MPETNDYLNPQLAPDVRARDLVSRMTAEEKVWQMLNSSPEISRLGVPAYDWWNEALHGVARAGTATVFPQAIALASTFNTRLMGQIASAISDEARAKHHALASLGDRGIYKGLTFWSPNINIFRDPRWGRGHETYGECPYLTGRMGVEFVKGLQGDNPKHLKLVATPKHFAAHSGPEKDRHSFDARVSPKDLRETYLPAFRECVMEAGAESVMGAYNRTNSEPCCASPTLLQSVLRDEWGFQGYVVSDCGAICDIHAHHKVTNSPAASAALAVSSGCDLCCGDTYVDLVNALEQGLITEAEIDRSLVRLFTARIKLGMFDPPEQVAYAQIPYGVVDSSEHRQLSITAARECIVLLKNERGLLPLGSDVNSIAVIGPNADNLDVLLANYNGTPSKWVTPLAGIIARAGDSVRVHYSSGSAVTGQGRERFAEALAAANASDVVVMCLGLSPRIEGEEGDAAESDGGGDRLHIDLPDIQQQLLESVLETGKPVVLVVLAGSAVAINWASEHVPAILYAWYPGQEGGTAIAEAIFGDFSPAGRMPITIPRSLDDVPPFEDYSMQGRTYRYSDREPLYPFGFGLSYSSFSYSDLRVLPEQARTGEPVTVTVSVANSGRRPADEVVQVYLSHLDAPVRTPIRQLAGLRRITLEAGEDIQMSFDISPRHLAVVDDEGETVAHPGRVLISVGGSQPDERSRALGSPQTLSRELEISGEPVLLPR